MRNWPNGPLARWRPCISKKKRDSDHQQSQRRTGTKKMKKKDNFIDRPISCIRCSFFFARWAPDGNRAPPIGHRATAATHKKPNATGITAHRRNPSTLHLAVDHHTTMSKHRVPRPTVVGSDGRHWFAAYDNEAGWERFGDDHEAAVNWGLPKTKHFCVAHGHIDRSTSGPIERLYIRQCSAIYYPTDSVNDSCLRSAGGHTACFADAMALIEGEQPLRPLMPTDYGQTVAARSGIALRDDASGGAFISTVEDARLCVLGDRMTVSTPLRRAIRDNCSYGRPGLDTIYAAARNAGGSAAAAMHAAGLVHEN